MPRTLSHATRTGLLVALLVVTSVLVVLRPWNATDSVPRNLGDPVFVTWTMTWVSGELISSPTSVFDAPIFHPNSDTLAYSDPLIAVAPVFGLVHAVTGRWTLGTGFVAVGLVALTMLGTFVLARSLTDRIDAAALAAVSMGLSDFVLSQWGHVQIQMVAALPWASWLLLRVLRRGRWSDGVWLGLVTGAMFITTASVALTWTVAVAVILAVHAVVAWDRIEGRAVVALAVTAAVAGLMALPVALPYLRLQQDEHFQRTEQLASLRPEHLLRPTRERTVLGWFQLSPRRPNDVSDPPTAEREYYPGLLALVLAPVGAVATVRARRGPTHDESGESDKSARPVAEDEWWRHHGVLLVGSAGLACAVVAAGPDVLGPLSPYRLLHEYAPGFSGLRVAIRFAMMTTLAVCVVAAAGWRYLAHRMRGVPKVTLIGGVLVLFAWAELAIPVRWAELPTDEVTLAPYHHVVGGSGAIAELPMARPGPGWDVTEAPRQLYATIDGRPRVGGFSGFWPPGYLDLVSTVNTFPEPAALDALDELGVTTVILHEPTLPEGLSPTAATRVGEAWIIELASLPLTARP